MTKFLRRLICSAAVLTLASTGLALAQEATFQSQTEAEVVPGQYIVKTVPGFNAESLSAKSLGNNVRVIDTLPLVGVQVVEIDGAAELGVLTERALQIPGVAYVEPVYVVRANATPNDPQYPQQWGFLKIKAPAAWDLRKDSGNMVVLFAGRPPIQSIVQWSSETCADHLPYVNRSGIALKSKSSGHRFSKR